MKMILAIVFAMASVVSNPGPAYNHFYEFPIEDWEEAFNYTYMMLGGTEPDICNCIEDSLGYGNVTPLVGPLPQQTNGMYGTPTYTSEWDIVGYSINIECQVVDTYYEEGPWEGLPKNGTFAYRIDFNPNREHIYKLSCNPEFVDTCGEVENVAWNTEDPSTLPFICGDGRCSVGNGEDCINCPDDCACATDDPGENTTEVV